MDRKKFLTRYVVNLFLIVSLSFIKGEQAVYQSIRIFYPSTHNIELIGSIGIPLDHISGKKEYYMDIVAQKTILLKYNVGLIKVSNYKNFGTPQTLSTYE